MKMENEKLKLQQEFKKEIENTDVDVSGYRLTFPKLTSYDSKNVRIEKNNCIVRINYDDEIFGEWHTHKTNKIWVLNTYYRRTRYASLENALKKAIESLDDMHKRKIEEKKRENDKIHADTIMENFAEKNGFVFEQHWRRNCTINLMKKRDIEAEIIYNNKTGGVEIKNYTITRDNIKIEDLLETQKKIKPEE